MSHHKYMEKSHTALAQLHWWHGAGWEEQWQGSENSSGMFHSFDKKAQHR